MIFKIFSKMLEIDQNRSKHNVGKTCKNNCFFGLDLRVMNLKSIDL